jgi:hypothetical protein
MRPGTSHAPVTLVDLLPTLADLAGAAAPGGRALDGGSIAPLLRGNHTATIVRRAPYLLWHQAVDRQPQTAILMDGLKLVKLWPSGLQLFNLGENRVAEGRNLVAHGLASRLHARLRAHLNAAGAETRKTVEKRSNPADETRGGYRRAQEADQASVQQKDGKQLPRPPSLRAAPGRDSPNAKTRHVHRVGWAQEGSASTLCAGGTLPAAVSCVRTLPA